MLTSYSGATYFISHNAIVGVSNKIVHLAVVPVKVNRTY